MAAPAGDDPSRTPPAAAALLALAALWLVVGLLLLGEEATGDLALVVGPSALLAAAGALLAR